MASLVQPERLNFILTIPTYSESSSTPMTELAILLASRGVNVTIITTHDIYMHYKGSIDLYNTTYNINIRLLSLDDPPGQQPDEARRAQSLETLMQYLVPPPSCIVSVVPSYNREIASKFRIPFYSFNVRSVFSLVCSIRISKNKQLLEGLNPYTDSFVVPNIPHKIELKGYQSPFFNKKSRLAENEGNSQSATEKSRPFQGMLVNSFEELEPMYLGQFQEKSSMWAIGPVSLSHKEIQDRYNRGRKVSIDAYNCLTWLDSMTQGSVIYACFGSMSCITPSQSIEIGLGLESSNQPFIWVIRDTNYSAEIGKWLDDTEFEKRVDGRGLVIRGWAPQLVILSHPSIRGFITHCGWNSTIEGICSGVPMITWPLFEEQYVNEKFVTDVLGIGLSIFVEARLSSEEVIIKSDRVKEAIEELRNGEKAVEMTRRARKARELANKAVEKGGSSHSNITKFIQVVMLQVSEKKEQANQLSNQQGECSMTK